MANLANPEASSSTTFIRVYDGALAPRNCKAIIDRFEADTANQYAGSIATVGGEEVQAGLKSTTEIRTQSPGWEDVDARLYECLRHYLEIYLRELGSMCQLPGRGLSDQPYRIKRYAIGNGFDWHIDNGTRETATRVLAAQWYLNDVAVGGETEFFDSGRRIACVEGRLVLFPVQWTLLHRGRAPESNAKYIVTTFFEPRF